SASRDAELESGRFPLVLWTPRYGVTAYQAVLCELLASRGYMVAFARPVGGRYALPYEPKDAAAKQKVLQQEVKDGRAALDKLEEMPNVDRSKIAVIGWSYAGESATLLQMSDPTVRLVIGLSTNLLTGQGYWTAEEAAKLDAAKLNVPYVVLTESIG